VAGQWFSPGTPPIKTDCHNITKILLKVVLNTINQTNQSINFVGLVICSYCQLQQLFRYIVTTRLINGEEKPGQL
jgi:hypothetical protein